MRIILTADEGLFTEYGNRWWNGYISCFPVERISPSTFESYCPRIPSDSDIARRAPLSLRIIESVLKDGCCSDSEVACVDPRNLDNLVGEDTDLVCVSVMDPLGLGYITRSLSSFYGGTPYSKFLFERIMRRIAALREVHDLSTMVGGPGAWQLNSEVMMNSLGIDFLVIGECENALPALAGDLLSGSIPEERVRNGTRPSGSDILPIGGPASNGLIEVNRGCSRNCVFCAMEPGRRDIESSTIVHSARASVMGGTKHLTLQSDDPLEYGSKRHHPDIDAVVGLLGEIRGAGAQSISLLHTTFASVACEPDMVPAIKRMMGNHAQRNLQIGLETGSPELMERHMGGKCLPFSPEEWPDVVRSSLDTLRECGFSVWATLIIGLPGETPQDVRETRELLKGLISHPITLVPIFFFPMREREPDDQDPSSIRRLNKEQFMLLREVGKHNAERGSPDLRDLLDLFPGSPMGRGRRFGDTSLEHP
jgi:radical SAM superfamily enzyme YgiQ (UPF0313 family)